MCMLWLETLYYIRASICDPDDEVRVCACCGWEHYITSGPVFVIIHKQIGHNAPKM